MNIGTLTATLGLDASQATASMSAFQRQMLTSVTQINATLIAMSQKMGVVAVSAENMANRTLAATNKIVVATRTASTGLGTFAQKIVAAEANAASNSLIVSPTGKSSVVAANKKAKEEVDKTPITPVFDPTQAIKNIDAYTTTIFRSAQRWRTVGYLTSIVLTAPLLMVGKAAIQAASDFEFAMKKTIGLAGIAKSAIKGYSDELLKMAISTAQTPKALAEAFYFTTSAGFKNGAEAIKIVDTAAKAATAGMGEASDVAKLLVFSMNAYKQSGVTAAHAADIFTTAVKEGAIEAEGFAASIQSVISIAAPLGVDLETVAGSMAAMSLQGATAAKSATYLRGMLNSLLKIKPTNEAGKALAEMGVNVNSLFNTLKEKGGLLKVLIQLQELSKGTTGNQFLKTIFADIRALTGELNLMGENLQYNIGLMDRMYNAQGALGTAVMGVADTIQVQKNRLQATFKVLMTELGKPLSEIILPMLQRLADTLKGLIEWFSGLSKGAQNTIIHILGLVAAIGPLALLASVLKYAYGGLFSFFGKGFLYITSLVKGLKGEIIAMQVAATMMPKLTGILGMTTAGGRVAMAGAKAATAATAATAGATTAGVAGAGIGAGIAGTVSAIPYVALAAAVGIATVAFIKLMRSQGEYDRVQKTAEGQRAQEIITMKGLFDRASDLKNSLEQRKKAIQAINDSYGEYLKNMLDETTSIDNIKNAYKDASNALILYTALKANTEARQEHEAKTNKQFGKSFGDIAVLLQKEKPDMLGDFYTDVYAAADKAINEGNAIIRSRIAKEEFKKIYEKYIGDISKQSLRGVDSLGQFLLASYKFMHVRATEMPFIAQVESLTSKLDKLKNKVQETNEALAVFINFKTPEIKMPEIPKLDGSVLGTFKNLGKGISIASPVKDLNVQLAETKKTLDNVTEKYKAFFTAKGYAFGGNKEMDDFILSTYEAMKALDVEAATAKRNGNEFNKNQELVSTLSSALDKMKETLGVTNPVYSFFAQILGRAEKALKEQKKELKELKEMVLGTTKVLNELGSSLASNNMHKFIEPNFDKVTADLETYKKAYEDYVKEIPSSFNIVPVPFGLQIINVIKLITKAKELKGTLDELTATQQKQADAKMLYVLNAEADAFGGLAGKIEVVSFALQATQRDLKDLFSKRYENKGMGSDEMAETIRKTVEKIKNYKAELNSLQKTEAIKYLMDMNDAMHTSGTMSALLSGYIEQLRLEMEFLSKNVPGSTEAIERLGKEMKHFERVQFGIEELTNTFNSLFDTIIDGGKLSEKTFTDLAKGILKDVAHMVIQMLIYKAMMAIFFPKKSGNINSVVGPGGLTVGGLPLSYGTIPGHKTGTVVPPGYPNDSYLARLTSGEIVIPAGGNDSALVELMKKLMLLPGSKNLLGGVIGIGDTTKKDPILNKMLQTQAESKRVWESMLESDKIYENLYKDLDKATSHVPITDQSVFKIKDIVNGRPGIRNNAVINKQVVADLARATAKEQQPLMPSLVTAMRETGIGSYLGHGIEPLTKSKTYNPSDVMQSLDAVMSVMPHSYEEFLSRKGRVPDWIDKKAKSGQPYSGDDLNEMNKVFLDMKNLQEYNKYIKDFKHDPALLEPFRKEVRYLGKRGALGYNLGEKDRGEKLAREQQVIKANPALYNYADSVYKATQHQQNIAAKGTPAMTGMMTLWTKLLGKKKEEPAPTVFAPTPKPDYTGMGIGFMNNPETWKAAFYEKDIPKAITGIPPMLALGFGGITEGVLGKIAGKGKFFENFINKFIKGSPINEKLSSLFKENVEVGIPGITSNAPGKGYHNILNPNFTINKKHWLFQSKGELGFPSNKAMLMLKLEALLNRSMPILKNTSLENSMKGLAEDLMARSGGPSRADISVLSALKRRIEDLKSPFRKQILKTFDKYFPNVESDMRNVPRNYYIGQMEYPELNKERNLIKQYLYGNQPTFEKVEKNLEHISLPKYKKLYPNAESFYMNSLVKHGMPITTKSYVPLESYYDKFFKGWERLAKGEILGLQGPENPIKPIDDVGGFLSKVIKKDNQYHLISQDLWKFNPKDFATQYSLPIGEKTVRENFNFLNTQKQAAILDKLGKPFYLIQHNPISKDLLEMLAEHGGLPKFATGGLVVGGLGLASQTANAQEIGKKKSYKQQYLPNDSINKVVSNLMDQRIIGAPWEGKNSKVSINNRALEEQAMKIFKDTYNRTLSKRDMSALQLGRASWTGKIPKQTEFLDMPTFRIFEKDIMKTSPSQYNVTPLFDTFKKNKEFLDMPSFVDKFNKKFTDEQYQEGFLRNKETNKVVENLMQQRTNPDTLKTIFDAVNKKKFGTVPEVPTTTNVTQPTTNQNVWPAPYPSIDNEIINQNLKTIIGLTDKSESLKFQKELILKAKNSNTSLEKQSLQTFVESYQRKLSLKDMALMNLGDISYAGGIPKQSASVMGTINALKTLFNIGGKSTDNLFWKILDITSQTLPRFIPGMAKGGIIPSGYPNDTYPAMLSSHEAVIPLNKMEMKQTVIAGDVRFEIEDNKLVGILRKYDNKSKRY